MTLIETWRQRGYEEGISVGREEGLAQGLEQGMKAKSIELISKLLRSKFSSHADTWIERADALTLDQLEIVADRILYSDNLAEIFEGLTC